MSRPPSTSPLLRHRSGDAHPFNHWALTTFWGLQFIWMGLHILFLTAVFTSSDRISVELFLLYLLSICTVLETTFEILVFTENTLRFDIIFRPNLYLRCNVLKCVLWGISSVITIINDYEYDEWGMFNYRGFMTAITAISMIVFIMPTIYAKDVASTIARHEDLLRYREENNIHFEDESLNART